MKKFLSWVLVLAMMLGTCSTAFALKIDGDDITKEYIENIIDITKAEVEDLVDVLKNGTDDDKAVKAELYIANVKNALIELDADEAKIAKIEADIRAGYDAVIALDEVDEYINFAFTVLTEAGIEDAADIVEKFRPDVEAIVAIAMDDLSAEEKIDAYIDLAAAKFGFEAVAPEIKDEVDEVIDIVEAKDNEAAKAKIQAYVEFLKGVLDITDADIAEATELVEDLIAEIEAFIEDAKELPVDEYVAEIKAIVDAYVAEFKTQAALQVAKIGHKHYEKTEDSYYVAIGGDTAKGTGIDADEDELRYFDIIGADYGSNKKIVADKMLLPSAMVEYIAANAETIAKADLITYQMDASSIIYSILTETPDLEKYLGVDIQVVIDEVMAQAEAVLAEDWAVKGGNLVDDAVETIKANVNNNLPSWIEVEGKDIDAIVDFCMPAINAVLAYTADAQNAAADALETVDGILSNEMVMGYAKKIAYAVVSTVVETKLAIEAIQAINPDATLVVLGMYNPANGLEIEMGEDVIAVDGFVDSAIDVANLYYAILAAANKDFAFVDISAAETDGFEDAIAIDLENIDPLVGTLLGVGDSMHANAAGHKYIAEQIVNALTCDYSKYVVVDEDNHALLCAICGDVKLTEAHDGDPCSKCGYAAPVVPTPESTPAPTPESTPTSKPSYGGGGRRPVSTPAPTPTPVNVLGKFSDIDANAWYYDAVKIAIEKGLMVGVSDTEFGPNVTLTRGMFVTILHRIEGATPVEAEAGFVDVPAGAYYAEAVKWAKANSIVAGISETEFAPNMDVTREQMAAMISRYATFKALEIPADGENAYLDAATISDFAKEAVKVTNKLGLLIGTGDGNFSPLRNASRAEAAALFVRLLDVLAK